MAAKIKFIPVLILAFVGLIAAFLLSQFHFNIWLESSPAADGPVILEPGDFSSSPPVATPTPIPSLPGTGADPVTTSVSPTAPVTSTAQAVPNGLRVKNLTNNPIRLVWQSRALPTQAPAVASTPTPANPTNNEPPSMYWDFAPMEGSNEGLILSLQTGNLRLQSGDVLMAFALDGSRNYWGPYVVGRTHLPKRQASSEWSLELRL